MNANHEGSFIGGGFECGKPVWNGHDLMDATRHQPWSQMSQHYEILRSHGMTWARDGLPLAMRPSDQIDRLMTARRQGLRVIWDLDHFWERLPDPHYAAFRLGETLTSFGYDETLWICPCNEPTIVPYMIRDWTVKNSIDYAKAIVDGLRSSYPNIRVVSVDAVTHEDGPWESTDALCEHRGRRADLVGLNFYPHAVRSRISDILWQAWIRHGIPVFVAETSWHDGYHTFPGVTNKAEWLQHVLDEIEVARRRGAAVQGLCWYPIVDCPPWDAPGSTERYSHGLIHSDLSLDPVLSEALMRAPR